MKLSYLLPLTATIQPIIAWGTLGHTTVALIASSLAAPNTETFLQSILHNKSSNYLAGVATWADSYRYTKAGAFSAPFHYIDAEDEPPTKCEVIFKRDCGGKGCVIRAVGNYTKQLLDTTLPAGERNMAAKFLVHFLGDIHQPLHAENLLTGGNGIPVTFDGVSTNLHHVWDTSIPEKLVGGFAIHFAIQWAANLTDAITTGRYKSLVKGWLKGTTLADPEGSALVWAKESNGLVCSVVLKDGVGAVQGKELGGAYYEGVVDVVELQVAKAGVRLAKWMDLIAATVKATVEEVGELREDL